MRLRVFFPIHYRQPDGSLEVVEFIGYAVNGVQAKRDPLPGAEFGESIIVPWSAMLPGEALALQFAWNLSQGDTVAVADALHPAYRGVFAINDSVRQLGDPAAYMDAIVMLWQSVGRCAFYVQQLYVAGDHVEALFKIGGVHTKPYLGFGGTGEDFVALALVSWELLDGKIAQEHTKLSFFPWG